ncbi:Alpha-crystallin A chain [Holothuria leucospilota]|uniref:Alpha-crystallin A chain n=1 Tax=Holothuria leucospilota TaxID=206669 RepID=A0A9Q0YS59_HOLLE|nr:Alpha-crystallin A chain [Holothuria leucospilota]
MNIEIKIPFTHPRVEYSISSDTQGVQIVPSVQSGSQVPVPQITFPPSGTSTPVKRQSITSIASSTPETSTVTRTTQKRTSTERRYEVKPTLYQGYYITPSSQTSPQITVSTSGTATPLQVQQSPTSPPVSPPRIANSERQASRVEYDNQRFSVTLDVSQYRPEDIEVKVKDNKLTVRAEHKEGSPETGYVQREYFRQYTLPEDVDVRLVKSYLSEDGMLSLDAPRLQLVDAGERVIPIQIRHQANDAGSLSPKGPFVEEVISDAESLRSGHKK